MAFSSATEPLYFFVISTFFFSATAGERGRRKRTPPGPRKGQYGTWDTPGERTATVVRRGCSTHSKPEQQAFQLPASTISSIILFQPSENRKASRAMAEKTNPDDRPSDALQPEPTTRPQPTTGWTTGGHDPARVALVLIAV